MPPPSFRTYLRVIRHRPAFWLGIALVVLAVGRTWVREGVVSAVVAVAIGLGIIVAAFPWWRRRAVKKPEAYTWGQPELLTVDRPVHPEEPTSNVTRIE